MPRKKLSTRIRYKSDVPTEVYKPANFLTPEEKSVIKGSTLLGRGYLYKKGDNALYKAYHYNGHNIPEEYIEWKRSILHKAGLVATVYENGNSTVLSTKAHEYLNQFYFDTNYRVTFMANIKKMGIGPVELAVWYMDSGAILEGSKPALDISRFPLREIKDLIYYLKTDWGIRTNLMKTMLPDKCYLGIVNPQKFFSIVRPHLHSSMEYLIPKIWKIK